MKILYLNGYFKVPDDCPDTLPDAIIALGNYLKTNKLHTYDAMADVLKAVEANNQAIFPKFVEAVEKRGRSFYGLKNLAEVNDEWYILREHLDEPDKTS